MIFTGETKRPGSWEDRTLTCLTDDRIRAIEAEMASFTGPALWDDGCDDADAENLWARTFYAREEQARELHTIDEMRRRMEREFTQEAALLGETAYDLFYRTVKHGGEGEMKTDDEVFAGMGLMRRLWAVPAPETDGGFRLPTRVIIDMFFSLAREDLGELKKIADEVLDTAKNTLYLSGVLNARVVIEDLLDQYGRTSLEITERQCKRTLESNFQTFYNKRGELMLAHDAVYDPRGFAREVDRGAVNMDADELGQLYASIIEIEDPMLENLNRLIAPFAMSGKPAEETSEDLLLLAKQNAPLSALQEVLDRRIVCLRTKDMNEALREMHEKTPRWSNLCMRTLM